jgi:Flp pilus assembly protein TadD
MASINTFKERAVSAKRTLGIVLAVGVAYIVIKGVANDTSQPKASASNGVYVDEMAQRQKEAERVASLESFTAADLAEAYSRNTYAADMTFKGKPFKVTGTVASINTDIRSKPYITMKGGVNKFMEPQFALASSNEKFAATLKPGDKITLACTGRGDVAKTPMSNECTFIWF